MMFVYVVVESLQWEGDVHVAVSTSLAKAREARQKCIDEHSYIPSDMHHYIEKWNTNNQESEEVE